MVFESDRIVKEVKLFHLWNARYIRKRGSKNYILTIKNQVILTEKALNAAGLDKNVIEQLCLLLLVVLEIILINLTWFS